MQTKQLGEKYILLDLLGTGGMAEVYRSKLLGEKGFEKQIVIKKLLPLAAQNKELVNLFIGEAKLAAMLQHENIAATFDFGEIDGTYFIAMEYLSGVNLHTLMTKTRELGSPMEIRYALMIISKICAGMDYAHRLRNFHNKPLNIIHRDLTPHNILITYEGKVKVFDFGIAKAEILDNKTQAGVVKGKLSYMSPEQISGEMIDSRSDIFSIGILLYEMLSGRRMYEGDTATLIQKCLTVDYKPLRSISPDLPPELYAILDKSLERDRELRYQSCAEMQSDVEDLMFSMAQRSDSKLLQNYIRGLFATEFKAAQNKTVKAMSESSVAAEPASNDKTVVLQTDTTGDSTAHDTQNGLKQQVQPLWGRIIDAQLIKDKRFVIGVSIAFLIFAAVLRPLIFRQNDADMHSPELTREENAALAQSRVIEELYAKAEQGFAFNRLVEPADDCALKYYNEILDLEPTNALALAGLNKIGDKFASLAVLAYKENELQKANHQADMGLKAVPNYKPLLEIKRQITNLETADRYAKLAEKAMRQGRFTEAQEYIGNGLAEAPEHEKLLALRSDNARRIASVVNVLAEKARKRLEENNLVTPVGDSALTYFDEIRKIDPDSQIARQGYRAIADRYAFMADEAYRMLNLEKAKEYVNRGLEIVPDHERLLAIRLDLTRSKPGIFIQSMKKNIGNILSN